MSITSGKHPHSLRATVTGTVIDLKDRPVVDARMIVLIQTFSNNMHEALKVPQVWTAITDDDGRYSFASTVMAHPNNEVRIWVVADGFADLSVRNAELSVMWDSVPFPVDADGCFSLSIPSDGKAVGAIYPTGFAPQFVDVTSEADQSDIAVERGVAHRGRVVDRNGQGFANIIVSIRKIEFRIIHASMIVIGTAVWTDETGHVHLLALNRPYALSVGCSIPDYSGQMMLDGESTPSIEPVTIEFDVSYPDGPYFATGANSIGFNCWLRCHYIRIKPETPIYQKI